MKGGPFGGGTGARLTEATVVVAGVACLAASLLSAVYVFDFPRNENELSSLENVYSPLVLPRSIWSQL